MCIGAEWAHATAEGSHATVEGAHTTLEGAHATAEGAHATAAGAQVDGVPAPLDVPYPGLIDLQVDATDLDHRIFKVRESIPVSPGALTLLHPQWVLGTHATADRQLAQLAGLTLSGNRQRIEWVRDPSNVYAFHVQVPPGVAVLQADFEFLSPVTGNQGAVVMTPEMLALHWESLLLYPAGYYARRIPVKPSVRLPRNWPFAGALETSGDSGDMVEFKAVNLEELIDSPEYAGRHFKRIDLDPGAKVPVFLDMFADNDAVLNPTPQQIDAHRAVVRQAYKLFGSHHYDHYDMLLALSDEFSFAGLEHHQSGENGVRTTYFSEWSRQQAWRSNLVSHEYIHSWDGKFRRPADQLTANFNQPLRDSLLWVYEGGTSYWGHVVGARAGLVDMAQMRDALASSAAVLDARIGRTWRSLQDTTNDPLVNGRGSLAWISWQRAEDYYGEGELIWLDVDTMLRELSRDKRSLDDFARAFFGVENGSHVPLGYTFGDVVAALNAIQPYDWAAFLRARLDGHGPGAPLEGITRAGWKLVYTEQESSFFKDVEDYRKASDFTFSLGLGIGTDGRIVNVVWDGAAFKAGLSEGYLVLAVDGRAYTPDGLKAAITAAKNRPDPIELIVKKDDRFKTVRFDYHDGLKYPRLERVDGTLDRLTKIFSPL